MKKALVFGADGQAGSYICEFLLDKGYSVVGTVRGLSGGPNVWLVSAKHKNFSVRHGIDVRHKNLIDSAIFDGVSLYDEVYNMTGKMFAPASWDDSLGYLEVNGVAPLLMLDAVRRMPTIKFFNAGSAGVFAQQSSTSLSETSPRGPKTPYDCAKHFAEVSVKAFREKYGVFACTGIFFNMESPRRPRTFFAQKVAYEVVRIKKEMDQRRDIQPMEFDSLQAHRDWGWTPDYVSAAWKMLQAPQPRDYVIGTGKSQSCLSFVRLAMAAAGLDLNPNKFSAYVKSKCQLSDKEDVLRAWPEAIKRDLGWEATYTVKDVVSELVAVEKVRQGVT